MTDFCKVTYGTAKVWKIESGRSKLKPIKPRKRFKLRGPGMQSTRRVYIGRMSNRMLTRLYTRIGLKILRRYSTQIA